jgi:hypothetical protein
LASFILFGGASLPLSLPTALHWLDRARFSSRMKPGCLIGSYIPSDQAQHKMPEVLAWYERPPMKPGSNRPDWCWPNWC